MPVQTLIDEIASTAGIDQQVAERAAGIVLSIILHEAPEHAQRFFVKLSGADALAAANDVMAPQQLVNEGALGVFSGVLGHFAGEKAEALVSGLVALEKNGLTFEQLHHAGTIVIRHLREIEPNLTEELLDHVPGLRKHFGG
ncbi:hypothetical protein AAIB41_14785 [Brucella sp. BE17]|uniref:hypothetical protein n=1 Tax=Brucella sp. BE17 TaxID=3142977 RepID=UPI0031BA40A9